MFAPYLSFLFLAALVDAAAEENLEELTAAAAVAELVPLFVPPPDVPLGGLEDPTAEGKSRRRDGRNIFLGLL